MVNVQSPASPPVVALDAGGVYAHLARRFPELLPAVRLGPRTAAAPPGLVGAGDAPAGPERHLPPGDRAAVRGAARVRVRGLAGAGGREGRRGRTARRSTSRACTWWRRRGTPSRPSSPRCSPPGTWATAPTSRSWPSPAAPRWPGSTTTRSRAVLAESDRHAAVFPDPRCRPDLRRGWSTDGLYLKGTPRTQKEPAYRIAGWSRVRPGRAGARDHPRRRPDPGGERERPGHPAGLGPPHDDRGEQAAPRRLAPGRGHPLDRRRPDRPGAAGGLAGVPVPGDRSAWDRPGAARGAGRARSSPR